MKRQRYAVIPTRNRPDDFRDCVAAIGPQVDMLFVIAHAVDRDGLTYPFDESIYRAGRVDAEVFMYHEDPPNISRMWNRGLTAAAARKNPIGYDVAVLNDDVIVPPDWWRKITDEMRDGKRSLGAMTTDVEAVQDLHAGAPDLPRIPGYAFILAGNAELYTDERFQWWYGDTDLEWRARAAGGVTLVPGFVAHRHPNSTTVGALADIAGEDRERFIEKWGRAPW